MLCRQVGAPAEEDLSNWGHHPDVSTLPDDIMKQAAGEDVTFVFSCQVCVACVSVSVCACVCVCVCVYVRTCTVRFPHLTAAGCACT